MTAPDLILYDEQFQKIKAVVDRLCVDSNARIVFLLDRNGQPIAHTGEMGEIDPTSLASLSAGNVAATEGLARLVGETEFANLYHEGNKDSLHISVVGQRMILLVIFDERSSLGLVRLRAQKASTDLAALIEEVLARATVEMSQVGADDAFAAITDADLDALFNE
jgi:predicted regulator of Ras-like GTPase activity (Roadblock/LC7/MglB family)